LEGKGGGGGYGGDGGGLSRQPPTSDSYTSECTTKGGQATLLSCASLHSQHLATRSLSCSGALGRMLEAHWKYSSGGGGEIPFGGGGGGGGLGGGYEIFESRRAESMTFGLIMLEPSCDTSSDSSV
jgi:hypothetical protein